MADVAAWVRRCWGEVDADCRNGVQSLENEVLYASDETPADLMYLVKSQFVQARPVAVPPPLRHRRMHECHARRS